MKRVLKRMTAIVLLAAMLCGCSLPADRGEKQYTATFLNLFDTVTSVIGYAESEEAFQAQAQQIHDALLVYHQLFDIYKEYDRIPNLKTVNDQAGIAPVKVDGAIIALLQDCILYWEQTGGLVNVAMGSVLQLWHEARSAGIQDPANAALPDRQALENTAAHTDISGIVIDVQASTVYLNDPQMSLDVGAIAKGWAAQKVAENAPEGMLISVGGNVCATGTKPGGDPWVIGVQDPDGGDNLHTIYVTGGAVVTSGDYQRTYTVDGKQYHHIIDPATQMPGGYWRSVTVVCPDSALADALSTALFLLPLEQGQALADACGAEALWIGADGVEFMTSGFRQILRT